MGSFYFHPFLCLKRAHLCSHASFYSSVEHRLQELLQCRPPPPTTPPPPPCNWNGSCRRANKERLAGSQNRERGRGRVVLSNLPQVSHMTQAIRAGRPWRLGQLATVSGCLAWIRYQVIVTGMRKTSKLPLPVWVNPY